MQLMAFPIPLEKAKNQSDMLPLTIWAVALGRV